MSWVPILQRGHAPIYAAICDAIAGDILAGKLKPGDKMPPHRSLADALGVTVGTVARAYTEATKRGLIVGEVGRGTFVTDFDNHREETTQLVVQEQPASEIIDLGLNLSATGEAEEMLRVSLRETARLSSIGALLNYQPAGGMSFHRVAAAKWLNQLGVTTHPDAVVITNGGQHGVLMSFMAVASHGECIATEHLTYPGAKAIAHQLGIHLAPLAMDRFGLEPDALRELCLIRRPRALYCMPMLHNPTTLSMSAERIREIATIAEEFDLWIIEDDVYGFLAADRPAPLATVVPDRTIHVTSTSKSMAAGLRVGFIAAPAKLIHTLHELSCMTHWMAPPLMTEIVANWILGGQAESLVAWHRRQARERQALAHRLLGPHAGATSGACYHSWLPLPEHWRMTRLPPLRCAKVCGLSPPMHSRSNATRPRTRCGSASAPRIHQRCSKPLLNG
ncbi:MAG: PLP-dependent aminotransferase family protein, partial [Gammaproteobacteria bacterium]